MPFQKFSKENKMRNKEIIRKTSETDIALKLELDGTGKSEIDTGCGFLDHMLELFSHHGRFDLAVKCVGDVKVDYHHTAEDIGICLGDAFKAALGDARGIVRYGDIILPMDEALIMVAVDLSGRGMLNYGLQIPTEKVGDFDTELVEEFFVAFARRAGITLHVKQLDGKNSHHIIEGAFKGVARAIAKAVAIDPRFASEVSSTKGVLL